MSQVQSPRAVSPCPNQPLTNLFLAQQVLNSCSFADFDPLSQNFLACYRSDDNRPLPSYLVWINIFSSLDPLANCWFLFFCFSQTGTISPEGKLLCHGMIEGQSPQKGVSKSLLFTCPSAGYRQLRRHASVSLDTNPLLGSVKATPLPPLPPGTELPQEAKMQSKLLLASADTASRSVLLWDATGASQKTGPERLECKQKSVIDIKSFCTRDEFVGTLTDDELFLYKYQ